MDSFWKSALEAAEKAKSVAKAVSQKGIEFAETTAEEASKRFKDLGLHDAATAHITPKQNNPTDNELASYGITPAFIEYVRCLNYNAFREHPLSGNDITDTTTTTTTTTTQPPPSPSVQQQQDTNDHESPTLNTWQLRHATLIVRAVKEVNELRYVLCPRYMNDETFWVVYFSLCRNHLPDIAFIWKEGDYLPPVASIEQEEERFMSFEGLGTQLRSLSSKITAAASAAAVTHGGSAGVQLATILKRDGSNNTHGLIDSSGNTIGDDDDGYNGGTSAVQQPKSLLGVDPEIEAYLQDAEDDDVDDEESSRVVRDVLNEVKTTEGGGVDDSSNTATTTNNTTNNNNITTTDTDTGDAEIDLDKYLNELSAEIDDDDDGGGLGNVLGDGDDVDDDDVDAVLRQLQIEVGDDDE